MTYLATWAGSVWAVVSIAALVGGPIAGVLAPFTVKPRWLGFLALAAGFAVSAGAAVSLGYATALVKGPH